MLPSFRRTQFKSYRPLVEVLEDRNLLSGAPTFFVNGRSAWSNTGIDVLVGQTLSITATGFVNINVANQPPPLYGPDGAGVLDVPNFVIPGISAFALIGRIDNTLISNPGRDGFVGSSYTTVVTTPGRLYLGCNDTAFGDNGGGFTATITISSNPDIVPTQLAWNTKGVDFGYKVTGADLPQSTTVALYWSSDNKFDANDTFAYDDVTGTHVNTYGPFSVPGSTLKTAPIGTTYLLLVVDPNNQISPMDNAKKTRSLATPSNMDITQGAVNPRAIDITSQKTGLLLHDAAIQANFIPNYGFTLDTAAHLSGVDHFNWLQVITNDNNPPPLWSGQRPHVNYLDPPNGGYNTNPPLHSDNLPYYWNESVDFADWEPVHFNNQDPDYDITNNREPKSSSLDRQTNLVFTDVPSDKLENEEYLGFTTFLVGVSPDRKSWHAFSSFIWRSNLNASTDKGGVFDIVKIRSFLPDSVVIATGGVFGLVPNVDPQTLPLSVRVLLATSGCENISLAGPLINHIPDVTINRGSQLAINVTASDSDPSRILTYSLNSGPIGASINPFTGLFAWIPTNGPATTHVTVMVTDNGTPALSDTQTFLINVQDPVPAVDKVIYANNQTQRSKFLTAQVYFDSLVTIQKNAFQLYLNNKPFTVSNFFTTVVDGKTVATLQFPYKLLPYASLPEGSYRLVVHGSSIKNLQNQKMTGDFTDSFFRLYGDVNGDGKVDGVDQSVFNTAYGKKSGQLGYLWFLDYDGNGKIDAKDKAAFKARMGKHV
ncbi:MAG TPA: hypothetical protein PLN21_16975 [Gemmatales bacterium]|nr:hypothetical protein [Gemmatales bacterium]